MVTEKEDRRGWIRIVEAFTAILIFAGIVLLVMGNQGVKKSDTTNVINNVEISILREIQLSDSLRSEVLATSGEVEWNSFSSDAPQTQSYIEDNAPSYLECIAKICDPSSQCVLSSTENTDIYAESVTMSMM